MLRSLKELLNVRLAASDGEVGHVKDFYFDDQRWVIRYVVADTGNWLLEHLILLAPRVFGDCYQDGEALCVNLTRQQIENSPSADSDKPVSRQHEEESHRYYGWPHYSDGCEMTGMGDFPVVTSPYLVSDEQKNRDVHSYDHDDPHLRSAQAVIGYEIHTGDGPIGHISDLVINEKSWEVRHLAVETGHWYSGKKIVISPDQIERISHEESKVFVRVTKEAIQDAPEYRMPHPQYHSTRNFD